ncbi:MAG: Crp/Fnr family transcriptional regulator [Flavobacteriaceae bacterium]
MSTMMKMCDLLEMENIDKGQVIKMHNRSPKCIFFLKTGTIKIMDLKNNSAKYIVQKGNIFGELALYSKEALEKEEAVALEDCIICFIESDMMEELMEKHKSLKNGILKIYGLRIKRLERRLQDLLYKDSRTRILEFVTSYVHEFGREEQGRRVAKNLLSHKDIANLTNTSRQTVNNILSTLRKESRIDYDSQTISMPLIETLKIKT